MHCYWELSSDFLVIIIHSDFSHKNRIAQYRILPDGEGKLYVKVTKSQKPILNFYVLKSFVET